MDDPFKRQRDPLLGHLIDAVLLAAGMGALLLLGITIANHLGWALLR